MIKGVNKKVIEINRPDSMYFERAVLYLKPHVSEVPLKEAKEETERYFKTQPRKFPAWLMFLLGMATTGILFAFLPILH